ncbi:hypothetical protein VitviT2T_020478 [Vitis vinifera]|uniref:Uncharacterized protein n=1 Tax=Vitis vinifera TaxID=29760 RepID=A0ABY9D679_VITVI|nr:hypothetical protein VitviT2T_020478 [Vitis vinifera]
MDSGTGCVSWLGSWTPSKAPWHASWHGRWHVPRVLAWLLVTMKGSVARVMARAVARVMCLGLAPEHHERPLWHASWHGRWYASWHGRWHESCVLTQLGDTKQGLVAHISCLGFAHWHHARLRGMSHGTGGGTRRVS